MNRRLNLNEWFKRRTSRPILIGHGLIIVLGLMFTAVLIRNDKTLLENAIDDFIQVAPRAINQQNRPMIESLLISFGGRIRAQSVGICNGNEASIAMLENGLFCSESNAEIPFLHQLHKISIPGLTNQTVYFVIPMFYRFTEMTFILAVVSFFIGWNLVILRNVGNAIWKDMIFPIQNATIEKVNIAEVYDLLASKEESERLRTKVAVSEARRNVANRVAHDIRSPLSALNILVQRAKGLTQDQREMLIDVSQRITSIADDLLRREKAEMPVDIRSHQLRAIFDELQKEKCLLYTGSNLNFSFEADPSVYVMANGNELKRILSNLINNAVEAMNEIGQITVSASVLQDWVVLSVCDDGPGISRENLTRIGKEKFTTKPTGNGIGLMGTFAVIGSWGGRVQIESELDKGTKVHLHLKSDPKA